LALSSDSTTTKHISADGWWSIDPDGFFCIDNIFQIREQVTVFDQDLYVI